MRKKVTISIIVLSILALIIQGRFNWPLEEHALSQNDSAMASSHENYITLKIKTQPEGSNFFIDEHTFGKTPTVLELPKDQYTLVVKQEGYMEHITEFIATEDEEIEIHLTPSYGAFEPIYNREFLHDDLVQKRIYKNNDERIKELHPDFQPVARHFIELTYQMDFSDIGLPGYMVMITEGYRSVERQNLLFRQGGITLALGGQSWHNYGLAIDVTAKDPQTGQTLWELPLKIRDKVALAFYRRLAEAGKELGLIWGGDFISIIDMPHFEWHPEHNDIFSFLAKMSSDGQRLPSRGGWNTPRTTYHIIQDEASISIPPTEAEPYIIPAYPIYKYWPDADPWPFVAQEPPNQIDMVPGPQMILIEGGTIQIKVPGTRGEFSIETVTVNDLFVGLSAVSNSEFRKFISDGGYHNKEIWTDAGWEWKVKKNREKPTWWASRTDYSSDPYSSEDDSPVTGICWYEAVAYCNWLSLREGLVNAYGANGELIAESPGYRLPTEAEWENICGKINSNDLWEWCTDWYEEEHQNNKKTTKKYQTPWKIIKRTDSLNIQRSCNYPEYIYNVNIGFRLVMNKSERDS